MSEERDAVRERDDRYQHAMAELEARMEQAGGLNEALSIALNCMVMASRAAAGTFWFYDSFGDGRIHPKVIYGGADLGDFTLAYGEGIAGQVIANGKSTIVRDCRTDPRWAASADRRTGFFTHTMICMPLWYQQDTFGCIQILNKTDAQLFDSIDLQFAERLAAHTSYLFAAHHMLDDYMSGGQLWQPDGDEPTFTQLFGTAAFADTKNLLTRLPMVEALPEKDRTDLLNRSREIWDILNRSCVARPQKREFHLFEEN
jgi:putative methionine-R-sulfoxide reductase with GAF domain